MAEETSEQKRVEALLDQYSQTGNLEYWHEICQLFNQRIYVLVKYNTQFLRYVDTEETVSEIFDKANRFLNTYDRKRGAFYTWLYKITRNKCTDIRDRERKRNTVSLDAYLGGETLQNSIPDTSVHIDDHITDAELYEHVDNCLDELEAEFKDILVYKYLGDEEQSDEVVAQIFETPRRTLARYRMLAESLLKACLEKKMEHLPYRKRR